MKLSTPLQGLVGIGIQIFIGFQDILELGLVSLEIVVLRGTLVKSDLMSKETRLVAVVRVEILTRSIFMDYWESIKVTNVVFTCSLQF